MDAPALEAHEHTERAEHARHAADPFVTRVSITIALLAVAASIVTSLENLESARAIRANSQAVLAQDRATDAWNEFQADSLKKHLYGIAADAPGPNAARYKKTSTDQVKAQAQVRARAEAQEKMRESLIEQGEHAEQLHHWLTAAAALLEIGIGISSVAIVTKNKLFWAGALVLGVLGAVVAVVAWTI